MTQHTLSDDDLRRMIEQFTLKAETTTDLVAKEVLQEYTEACRVALKERMEDQSPS